MTPGSALPSNCSPAPLPPAQRTEVRASALLLHAGGTVVPETPPWKREGGPRDSSFLLEGSGGPLSSPATAPVSAVASGEGTLRTPEGRGGRPCSSAGSARGLGGEGAAHRWGERKRNCPDAPLLASSGSPRSRRRRGPQGSAWAPAAPSPQSPHTIDISPPRVLRKRAQVFVLVWSALFWRSAWRKITLLVKSS